MHMCVSKLSIIGSDNGLSTGRRQAIICTNVGILLIGPSNLGEILIKIHVFPLQICRRENSDHFVSASVC